MFPLIHFADWMWSKMNVKSICDQSMAKVGGVIVRSFWSSLLGDSRKFVASSLKVRESKWNSMRLKPALSTFHLKREVKKLKEQKNFKNAWKVSQFFAFFCTYFTMYLPYIAVFYRRNKVMLRHAWNANLFVHFFNLFILWI